MLFQLEESGLMMTLCSVCDGQGGNERDLQGAFGNNHNQPGSKAPGHGVASVI